MYFWAVPTGIMGAIVSPLFLDTESAILWLFNNEHYENITLEYL
jgi:hypothetical protein